MDMERNGRSGSGLSEAWSVITSMEYYSFYYNQLMTPMDVRYVYGGIFLIANFIALGLHENPISLFQIQRLSGCLGNSDCLAAEAVLMVSLTCFLFYFAMFLSTVYTRNVHDFRNSWHTKWWVPKIVLIASFSVVSIFAPTYVTQLYGKVAPFGAGLFIIIQHISVIRYITRLNSRWCGQENFNNHHRKVNMISILAYSCSMVGIILMIFWYMGCYVNVALVLSTVGLMHIMPIISLLSKDKGFYMEPMLIGVYIVFLCWSAIKSEPGTICYEKENTGSSVNWITLISFIVELASVTVAAFSTGTDYKCIQFTNIAESEDDIPYGYGFFHFVFAMGSMYFGMLFIGWDTHHASEKWGMDVDWTSTIVHIVNEGLAVIFFVLVILARFYEIGWLQQLLGKIFGIGGQQLADGSHAIELAIRSSTNNIEPPQDSSTVELERTETSNNVPAQGPSGTELVRTERADEQPSSSSSSTIGPLGTSEPQAPEFRRRQWGQILELW